MLVSLLLTLALCLALSWLPSYGLVRLFRALDSDEMAVAAWPVSWAVLGGVQFLGFVIGLPAWWPYVLLAVCCGLSVYGLAGLRRTLSAGMQRVMLIGLAGVAATICLAVVIPVYDGIAGWYGDWWMHYDISQFYLGLRPDDVVYFGVYSIPSRFPLFNLTQAALLSLLGNHFWAYQLASIAPLAGLIGAAYLVARVWLGRRPALLASALLIINPFVIQNALTPWPKVMAATCVLLGLAIYLRRGADGLPLWAFFSGLGILAHQGAVVFALAVALHALLAYRRAAIVPAIKSVLIGLLVLTPWLMWAAVTFGASAVVAAAPTLTVQRVPPGSPTWLIERVWNALGTLVPLTFMRQAVSWQQSGFAIDGLLSLYGSLLRYSYAVLPGALTTMLSAVVIASLWRKRRQSLPGSSTPSPHPVIRSEHNMGAKNLEPRSEGFFVAQGASQNDRRPLQKGSGDWKSPAETGESRPKSARPIRFIGFSPYQPVHFNHRPCQRPFFHWAHDRRSNTVTVLWVVLLTFVGGRAVAARHEPHRAGCGEHAASDGTAGLRCGRPAARSVRTLARGHGHSSFV